MSYACGKKKQDVTEKASITPARDDIKVEQGKIGRIVGPKGATIKHIKNTTGAMIWVDQSTQHEGWNLQYIYYAKYLLVGHLQSYIIPSN